MDEPAKGRLLLKNGNIVIVGDWKGHIIFDPLLDGDTPEEKAHVKALRKDHVNETFLAYFVWPRSIEDYPQWTYLKSDIVHPATDEEYEEFVWRNIERLCKNSYYRSRLEGCWGTCAICDVKHASEYDDLNMGSQLGTSVNGYVCNTCSYRWKNWQDDKMFDLMVDLEDEMYGKVIN